MAIVAIGLTSATLIFASGWPGWTDTTLIVIGQIITVVVPGLLVLSICRGVNRARWGYLGLTSIGVILRTFGFADSVFTAAAANASLQAASIAASLCSVILLLTPPARRYFHSDVNARDCCANT